MSEEISIDAIAKELEALHGHYGHAAGLVKVSGSDGEFASFVALVCLQELTEEQKKKLFGAKITSIQNSMEHLCEEYVGVQSPLRYHSDLMPIGDCSVCDKTIYQAQDSCEVWTDAGDCENGPQLGIALIHRACKADHIAEVTEEDKADWSNAPH